LVWFFFWLLAAIFEAIGFTKRRYVARGFAALLTIAGACIGTGYQQWWQVLIGIGAAFVLSPDIEEVSGQIGARIKMRNFSPALSQPDGQLGRG
jgi:hypothetical protein